MNQRYTNIFNPLKDKNGLGSVFPFNNTAYGGNTNENF